MNQMMERLANLEWWEVAIIVVVLLGLRFILLKQKSQFAKSAGETAESLAVAMALVFFIIRPFIIQAFFIPSASMHPGLLENDHILVNKFIYRVKEPKLGDVVVFKAPSEATPDGIAKDFIKRVIGVPGDTVRITPGYVLVGNDQYNHKALRHALQSLHKVKISDGRVYEDDIQIPNWEIARIANVPGAPVQVEKNEITGEENVTIGPRNSPLTQFDEYRLPDLIEDRHSVKLKDDGVYWDDKKVDPIKVAEAFGRPKAKVKVVPGVVYLNGKALNEPYIAEDPDLPYPFPTTDPKWIVTQKIGKERVQLVKIPAGKLLVMGDNRNNSNDARFWGLLDRNRVLGKAMVIFWPLNRIRLVR